jgi:hypothetical protein
MFFNVNVVGIGAIAAGGVNPDHRREVAVLNQSTAYKYNAHGQRAGWEVCPPQDTWWNFGAMAP